MDKKLPAKVSWQKFGKLELLIVCTLIITVGIILFLQNISTIFCTEMSKQKEAELTRLVGIAYSSIEPIVQGVKNKTIEKEEALTQIRDLVRTMTYTDEFGDNYIFMSSYDGTMLVQPFEPQKEGTNQWDLKDAEDNYIIQKLIEAAKKTPTGSFVTYSYYPPGKEVAEEKLSFVRGIPEIDVCIGTGMYLESGYIAKNLLKWQRYGPVFCVMLVFLLMSIYLKELIQGQQLLHKEIGQKQLAEQALREEKEKLAVTLQSIGDGVIATDKEGNITFMNLVAEDLTGWSGAEAMGKPLITVFNIISEDTLALCENPVAKVLRTGQVVELANHTALLAKDGTKCLIADSAAPIKNSQGEILGVVLVFRDVTAERLQKDKIISLSYHDSLTGLHNRRYFEKALKSLDGPEYYPLAIVVGDVNGLKMTNDVFGHEVGDRLLQKMSRILTQSCRKEDVIARWGGDEFIILMPETSFSEAEAICNKIQQRCDEAQEDPTCVSISLGLAVKETAAQSIWQVQREAEDRMYRNKLLKSRSFRNKVITSLKTTLFEKSMETEEHGERLKIIGMQMGQALGLSSLELGEMELFAMLHDIGKIAINESILSKPGKLTPLEWENMKKHSEIGYRIAQATPELARISEYILSHHEWWDGSGYPQGLEGDEIPLLSRILAIVDAYDALTNDRIYRQAISPSKALEEIKRFAGIQFDPKLVKLFTKLVRKEIDSCS